jgi:hypothetical protein
MEGEAAAWAVADPVVGDGVEILVDQPECVVDLLWEACATQPTTWMSLRPLFWRPRAPSSLTSVPSVEERIWPMMRLVLSCWATDHGFL